MTTVDDSAFTRSLVMFLPAVSVISLPFASTASAAIAPSAVMTTVDVSAFTLSLVMSLPALSVMSVFLSASICAMSILPTA